MQLNLAKNKPIKTSSNIKKSDHLPTLTNSNNNSRMKNYKVKGMKKKSIN
jgi:hypothetical protein